MKILAKILPLWAGGIGLFLAVQSANARVDDRSHDTALGPLQRCLSDKSDVMSFSGVISVTQRGRPIALIARGVLAGPGSAPITARTRFNLGSMSKMFTAVAVGQLVDSGKVKLDEPVGRYVSGLTPEVSAVTVRQLLMHTSGLGDFFALQNMEAMLKARTATDLLPLIDKEKPAFPPGSRFRYSNSGFALLGVLIERVSAKTYDEYLRDHVFEPAGMAHTGVDPQPLATLAVGMTGARPELGTGGPFPAIGTAAPQGAAAGRVLIGPDGKPMTEAETGDQGGAAGHALEPAPGATQGYGSPAGGLFSTAADMQAFAAALLSGKLTTPSLTAALVSPQVIVSPATATTPERAYGLGFGVGLEAGHKWFGHNGGTLGANTEFAVFPDLQLTITVLANRDPPLATEMFHYLKGLILGPPEQMACGTPDAPRK